MKITFRTGSVDCHFGENASIALRNLFYGRPLDEGRLPPTHIPDPLGLPEWVTIEIPDSADTR